MGISVIPDSWEVADWNIYSQDFWYCRKHRRYFLLKNGCEDCALQEEQSRKVARVIPGDEIEEVLDTAVSLGDLVGSATLVAEQYDLDPKVLIAWYEGRLRLKAIALQGAIHDLSPRVT